MPRTERFLLIATGAIALVLRVVAWRNYRFDSDEQQHLHVAWGWTAGLVQYRDVFDNHAPLFHILTAPVLAMLGERSDILLWMRLISVPVFAFILWATFVVGRELYDRRVAAWSVVLLALFPPFFLKSLEYRPDNLWTALSMLALLLLVRDQRPFWIGMILGLAFAVSVKTSLLVIALGVPLLLQRRRGWVEAIAGFAIVPAIVAAAFVAMGAWDALVFCNVTFNSHAGLMRKNLWIARSIFPFTAGAVLWASWRTRNTAHPWRWFLATSIGVFTVTITGFWPLISPRDFLPLMPLAAIFVAAALAHVSKPVAAFAASVVILFGALYYYADRFENRTDWHITMMDQALRLTRPGELLMDYKGETIYRRRPFYYAFEFVTRSQMSHGLIADTVARDVVRTRTYVAQADGPMWPPASRAWLSANFVNLGRLRATGQWLREDGTFTIAIPGRYVVLDENGIAPGMLDGTPHLGPRTLSAGAHRFEGKPGTCVVWAPAFERGHSPFHLRDLDF